MKKILALLTVITAIACSIHKKNTAECSDIQCVYITHPFPKLTAEGKLMGYDSTFAYIYRRGNQMMYHTSYHYDSSRTTSSGKYEIFYSAELFKTFVYTSGSKYAALYDNHYKIFNQKVPVDSIMGEDWTSAMNFYGVLNIRNKCVLEQASVMPGTDTLLERYQLTGMPDTTLKGFVHLWFVPAVKGGSAYSLSPQLDSMKQMRLVKVRIENKARYMPQYKLHIDALNQDYEMREVPVKNCAEIKAMFDRDARGYE